MDFVTNDVSHPIGGGKREKKNGGDRKREEGRRGEKARGMGGGRRGAGRGAGEEREGWEGKQSLLIKRPDFL